MLRSAIVSRRLHRPASMLVPAVLMPFYKELLRWVRIRAVVMEILRIRYEDPFLPDHAWRQAPRF